MSGTATTLLVQLLRRRLTLALIVVPLLALGISASSTLGGPARSSSPTQTVLYYRVSAVNAAGESLLSNELAVTIPSPQSDFQHFVTDAQAAAYYTKWSHDNPGELNRWKSFRDGLLTGTKPVPPAMVTRYGAGLVDAGVIALHAEGP